MASLISPPIYNDINAEVGTEVRGRFGCGDKNRRGERLIEFAEENKLLMADTFFQMADNKRMDVDEPA